MSTTLAAAMAQALSEMPAVEADGVNPHFNSRFVTLDHLIAVTRPVLAKHGLAITQPLSNIDGQPALTTKILHGPSDQAMESTMPLVLAKQDMQGFGAAVTYARRYAWASLLGICDESDDDGNKASETGGGSPTSAGTKAGPAVESPPTPADPPSASQFTTPPSAQSTSVGFKWKYGPHAGKSFEETPFDYVTEYAETGKVDWLRDKCKTYIEELGLAKVESGPVGYTDPSEIPFQATI